MEFESSFLLLLLSYFIFIFILLSKTHKPNPNLPPGPRKLPIIGHLHLLASSNPAHHTLADLAKKHGPLMCLHLGQVLTLVVSSSETATEFLKTHDAIFASRPSLLATEINCYGNTDIAFAPYGKYWRQLRSICLQELLTVPRVQSFRPVREDEVSHLRKWIAMHEGSTINLTERLSVTNLNIMIRAAFGKTSGEVIAELIRIMKEAQDFLTAFNVVDVYPSFKILRVFSGLKRKIEKHHRVLDKIMDDIIMERKQRYHAEDHHDLLGVLLKFQSDPSLEIPLTTDNIKSVLLDGAGVESATTIIDWALAEMLKNPRVLKTAQEEVRRVFEGENDVHESSIDELKYLKLVINETLRLHPPGPLLLPRQSSQHCEINGYEIPARTWVMVNAWAIGRDPKKWEDAESFKPERFLEKTVDFKGGNLNFIPFGAGRRVCPGISFGMANVEIELAMLLYHFDWIIPNGMRPEDIDMAEFAGMVGRRKHDLCLIPIVRRPLPCD